MATESIDRFKEVTSTLEACVKSSIQGNAAQFNCADADLLTINVPLILKMQDIIFLRANYFMGHFNRYFGEGKTFLMTLLGKAKEHKTFTVLLR